MAETILNRSSGEQFKDDYTRYALYTTYKRVLSDFRDGLKPAQRRILYTMYKNTGAVNHTVKSAAVIGDCMKYYHPHGDCKHPDTLLYTLDHKFIRIEDVYNQGIQKLDILAVDPDTGKVIPAVATNFRIGQFSTVEYRIHLSNGFVDISTANHPYLTQDMKWVKAENLKPGVRLYCKNMKFHSNSGRPYIDQNYLHYIVHDYYNGIPNDGYERHHKDNNFLNNTPSNIVAITKSDHIDHHKGSESAIIGLDKGRSAMFDNNGKLRDKTKAKNSILATEFNKDQGIRRFKSVIDKMKESGMEITESNYESFRGSVYNLPIISRLIKNHPEYGSSFDELVKYVPTPLSELFENRKSELDIFNKPFKDNLIDPIIFLYEHRDQVYKVFDRMLLNNIPITVDNYYNTTQKGRNSLAQDKLECLIKFYKIENPYVESVEVVKVPKTAYYDFTVEGVENMLIPVSSFMNESISDKIGVNIPFICIHNSGLYAAVKPMVNWWESKVPLIDKQGNFGNLSGDPASAARYTECKLSKFAIDCVLAELMDTDKSVDWLDNYSNTCLEPEFLPVKVPLLLIEGSLGIGVGLKADIPAHNLAEVIDATIYLMHNPDGQIVLVPDHCMDCEIYDTDWSKISKTGFGHYKIRGKIDIEDYKGKKALVIKSLPDLTFLDTIKDKIEELVEKKKIIQIDRCYNECGINNMRFVIVLKNGADPNFVRDMIYKNTKMEQTLRVNFETLYAFNPLRMSYKSYLLSFIDFRKATKFRLYANKLQYVQTKLHERDAYIKVLESGEIDNIINMIKKQKTVDDQYLIDYLIKKLKITDLQAKYIISADLRKLSIGYLNKYKSEAVELEKLRHQYMNIIVDENQIMAEIEAELLEIKSKYGKPRTCTIIKGIDDNDIPKGMMQVAVTEKNFIRKVPEGTAIGSFRNDSLKTIIKLDNTDSILIFDEQGKVFKLPVHKIPFTDKASNGSDIRFLIKNLTANINCIIPESVVKELAKKGSHNSKHYLVTITKNGLYKRMDLDDFTTVPPSGILYAKLDSKDFIKDIIIAHSNFNLIVYSDRKAVSVNVNDIPYLKRNTKGSRAIYNADTVDGLCVIDQSKSDIITITESGKINRIPIMSLPIAANKKGFNVIKLTTNDKINSVVSANDSNILCIKTLKNYYEIPVSQLKVGSSISTGEKVIAMKADQMIRCWIK